MSSKLPVNKNSETTTKTNQVNQKASSIQNTQVTNKNNNIEQVPDKSTKNEMITKVFVENFPSRIEIFTLLDNYLQKNGYKKDYTSDNKDNKIIFAFKNPVIYL